MTIQIRYCLKLCRNHSAHTALDPDRSRSMASLTDPASRRVFKASMTALFGTRSPSRKVLSELAIRLSLQVGRRKPWTGGYLYALLHPDRWPQFGIDANLLEALTREAELCVRTATNSVTIRGRHVQEGAIVLASSRRCSNTDCELDFVPVVPTQKYCSRECARRMSRRRPKAANVGDSFHE